MQQGYYAVLNSKGFFTVAHFNLNIAISQKRQNKHRHLIKTDLGFIFFLAAQKTAILTRVCRLLDPLYVLCA